MTGYASPAKTAGQAKAWTRGLLRCGLAAAPAFVTAFVIEGSVRNGYHPLRHPVSSLALGPRGWTQTGNFGVTGTLFLAAAAGLARAGDQTAGRQPVPALIGAAGTGLIGAAIFPTDPVSGYPPGTPGALLAATAALAGAGFGQSPRLVSLGGLFQRVSIITGFGWLTVLSAREFRR